MVADPLVVIVGHGQLPAAHLATVEMLMGETEGAVAFGLEAGETPDDLVARVTHELDAQPGRPCLLLVDLFGGSPATAVAGLFERYANLQVVTGLNLPMLLEVLLQRDGTDASALAKLATAAGQSGVINVRERLDGADELRLADEAAETARSGEERTRRGRQQEEG